MKWLKPRQKRNQRLLAAWRRAAYKEKTMKSAYAVIDREGNPVMEGDTVTDFRGDTATFIEVTRPPLPGKSAKVYVEQGTHRGEYYASVFGLTVTPKS